MSYENLFFACVIALKIHALKIKVTVDLEKRLCSVIILFCFVSYSKNFRSGDFRLIIFLFSVFSYLNFFMNQTNVVNIFPPIAQLCFLPINTHTKPTIPPFALTKSQRSKRQINSVDSIELHCYTLPSTQHHSFFRNLPFYSTLL